MGDLVRKIDEFHSVLMGSYNRTYIGDANMFLYVDDGLDEGKDHISVAVVVRNDNGIGTLSVDKVPHSDICRNDSVVIAAALGAQLANQSNIRCGIKSEKISLCNPIDGGIE